MTKDEIVKKNIRELCDAAGIDDLTMAGKMSMPVTLYRVFVDSSSKFDNAPNKPLEKCAEILGVPVDDLLAE